MGIASEIHIWEEEGRLYSRVRTNADMPSFRRVLSGLGLEEMVEAVEWFTDPTREHGGPAFLVVFRRGAERGTVASALEQAGHVSG
jgi:hypothetical protein